ncbi:MAG: HD domain-containing protein, partial [Acidimicrobiales bacterium]
LWETAANAAALARRVARPDLLLVGALLHDIGKGYTSGPEAIAADHTDAGIVVVDNVATRMGFSAEDVATLVAMVRHHLLLPDVATRRDLDDPLTVRTVAATVGNRELLDLLAALTEADSLATGPSAWGSWKAGLVEDLVARTARRLDGHRSPEPPTLPRPSHRRLMVDRRLAVVPEGSQVTVVAPDRPGLFCRVAGTLALHNLDVRAASAGSENGMAVEVFEVEPSFGRAPNWARFADDVENVLSDRLSLDARLAELARAYASRRRVDAAWTAGARVLFDDGASATATVVEVRAPDGVGVLYRITRALAECRLDLRTAKVATLGHEVVDAFYVTEADGTNLDDPQRRAVVERAVLEALAR